MILTNDIKITITKDELELLKCAVMFTSKKKVADIMGWDKDYTKDRIQMLYDDLYKGSKGM